MSEIKLPHVVEADANITGISIDKNDQVTVNYQVVDVDKTAGTSTPVGDPKTLTLDADKSAAVLAAILPVIGDDVAANEEPATPAAD